MNVCYETFTKNITQNGIQVIVRRLLKFVWFVDIDSLPDLQQGSFGFSESDTVFISRLIINIALVTYLQILLVKIIRRIYFSKKHQ